MPTILRIGPYRFFFYSHESNEPEHIHIQSGDQKAKFWLTPVQLANSAGFNDRTIRGLESIVEEHRETFLESWHDYFKSGDQRP